MLCHVYKLFILTTLWSFYRYFVKIRRSHGRLIFTMEISIPGKTVFILRRASFRLIFAWPSTGKTYTQGFELTKDNPYLPSRALKTTDCQFDKFVVTDGTVCCHYDNLRCHQWLHNFRIGDIIVFSELVSAGYTGGGGGGGVTIWSSLCNPELNIV